MRLTDACCEVTVLLKKAICGISSNIASNHSFAMGDGNDALRPVDSDSLSLGGLDGDSAEEDLSDGDTDPDYREVQQA